MSSIEELKREKERLELERDVRRLQKQNDRREAVDKVAGGFVQWCKTPPTPEQERAIDRIGWSVTCVVVVVTGLFLLALWAG